MNVAVVGSRNFSNFLILEQFLNRWQYINGRISCIISGGARGTDLLAEEYAKKYNIRTQIFLPNFENEKYLWSAYFQRNKDIVNHSDCVIAFWDNKSKGTKNTLVYAKKMKKKIYAEFI